MRIISLTQGTGEEVMFMDTSLSRLGTTDYGPWDEVEFGFCGNIDAPDRIPTGATQLLYETFDKAVVFDIGTRRGRAFN